MTARISTHAGMYTFVAPMPTITYLRPPPAVTHNSVSLTLKNRPTYYTKESTIAGVVTLNLAKDHNIRSVKVVLEGSCRTEGIAQYSDATLQDDWLAFHENHRLVYQEDTLFPPANVALVKRSETTFKTPRGVYEYPFRFTFPAHAQCGDDESDHEHHQQHPLPLSYHMRYITTEVDIDYRIKVYVERVGFMAKDWFIMEPIPYLPLGPSLSQVITMRHEKIKVTSDLITLNIPVPDAISLDKELHGTYALDQLQQVSFHLGTWFPHKLVPGTVPDFKLFLLSHNAFTTTTKIQLLSLSLGIHSTYRFRAQALGSNGYREITNDMDFYTLKQPITVDLAGLHQNEFGLGELPFISTEPLDYALDLTSCLKRVTDVVNVEPTFRTCAFEVSHRVKLTYTFRSFVEGVPIPLRLTTLSQQVEITSRTMDNGWSTDEAEQLPKYRKELSPAPAFED